MWVQQLPARAWQAPHEREPARIISARARGARQAAGPTGRQSCRAEHGGGVQAARQRCILYEQQALDIVIHLAQTCHYWLLHLEGRIYSC